MDTLITKTALTGCPPLACWNAMTKGSTNNPCEGFYISDWLVNGEIFRWGKDKRIRFRGKLFRLSHTMQFSFLRYLNDCGNDICAIYHYHFKAFSKGTLIELKVECFKEPDEIESRLAESLQQEVDELAKNALNDQINSGNVIRTNITVINP